VAAPVGEQTLGGTIEQILVEQDADPDGDTKGAFGDETWRRRRGDDAGVNAAGAGGAVALAVDDAAMGFDIDLQDGGVVGAGKDSEGLAAVLTAALVVGQVTDLLGRGQVGIIASAVSFAATLLAAGAARRFAVIRRGYRGGKRRRVSGLRRRRQVSLWLVGSQGIGGVAGLGTATEEAVAEVAVFGLKLGELLLEQVFALSSALMLGLVVSGLPKGVAKLLAGRGAATGLVLGKRSGSRGAGGV